MLNSIHKRGIAIGVAPGSSGIVKKWNLAVQKVQKSPPLIFRHFQEVTGHCGTGSGESRVN